MSSICDKVTDLACTTARTILRCLIFRIKGHVIFQLDVNKNEKEFVFFSPTKYGLTGFCAPVFKELLFKRSGQEHFCRYLGCFILDVEVRWRLDSFFFSFHLTCLPMTVAWFGGTPSNILLGHRLCIWTAALWEDGIQLQDRPISLWKRLAIPWGLMAHWCLLCNEALRCNYRDSLKRRRPSTCGDTGLPTTEATYCPIQSSCLIFLIYKQASDSQPLIKTQFAFPEQCILIDTIWARVGALQKL